MENVKRFLPWPAAPLQGVTLSASGLLALADLSTIANRTAITGTSTWLDILVLAPGIHNQQRAETLPDLPTPHTPPILTSPAHHPTPLTNAATIRYLARVGSSNHSVTLQVGPPVPRAQSLRRAASSISLSRARRAQRARRSVPGSSPGPTLVAPLLYALALCLTVAAMVLMVLTRDWWGVGILGSLMLARALNVWIIRGRTAGGAPPPCPSSMPPSSPPPSPVEPEDWRVTIDGEREICLRGQLHDLEALTGGVWMRAKTVVEGYVEAAAKLIVYLVAAFSGNMRQTGNIVLLVLLLCSAGLLALSNATEDRFWMNGRTAVVVPGSGNAMDGGDTTDWGGTTDGGEEGKGAADGDGGTQGSAATNV